MSGSNGNGRNGNGKAKPPGACRLPLFETDPTIRTRILESVALGMSDKQACDEAGIMPNTLAHWKLRSGAAYEAFVQDLNRARLTGLRGDLKMIHEDKPDPNAVKARTWLISRLFPDRFSEKRILEHRDDSRADKRRKALSDPDLRADLDRAARRMGSLREPG